MIDNTWVAFTEGDIAVRFTRSCRLYLALRGRRGALRWLPVGRVCPGGLANRAAQAHESIIKGTRYDTGHNGTLLTLEPTADERWLRVTLARGSRPSLTRSVRRFPVQRAAALLAGIAGDRGD